MDICHLVKTVGYDFFYLEDKLLATTCRKSGFLLDPVNYFDPSLKIKKITFDCPSQMIQDQLCR